MNNKLLIWYISAFLVGLGITYGVLVYSFNSSSHTAYLLRRAAYLTGLKQPKVIGFFPYWLITKADKNYADYLSDLTYFGVVINNDGSIMQYTNPGEAEPGLYALESGKINPFLEDAKANDLNTTLLAFQGRPDDINHLVSDPIPHANTFVSQIAPIMKKYGFTDLNVDIESIEDASPSARQSFTTFIKEVRRQMDVWDLGDLIIDSSPTDLIKDRLIDLEAVEPYVDSIVLMTYDYHYMGSSVTGPVAPQHGAGTESEFDVETGIQKALEVLPKEKIILGIPLYGYRWESITDTPRSGTMPGSGLVVTHRFMEEFLDECATCSAITDDTAQEPYVIYKDDHGTYYQAFYPDINSIHNKLEMAKYYELDGVALWAIGYEGDNLLQPIKTYKQSLE